MFDSIYVLLLLSKTTFDAHTDPIFQNLGVLKFHDIYLIQLGLFMYSYQNHTLPLKFHCKFTLQSQIHSYNTRNSCKFRLPFCRTRTKQFSVFYQGPKFYNTLNTNIINASSPFSFKRALKAFICNNYLYTHSNRNLAKKPFNIHINFFYICKLP